MRFLMLLLIGFPLVSVANPSEEIFIIQGYLKKYGLDVGELDGLWGPNTYRQTLRMIEMGKLRSLKQEHVNEDGISDDYGETLLGGNTKAVGALRTCRGELQSTQFRMIIDPNVLMSGGRGKEMRLQLNIPTCDVTAVIDMNAAGPGMALGIVDMSEPLNINTSGYIGLSDEYSDFPYTSVVIKCRMVTSEDRCGVVSFRWDQ